jgi:hypothetical protein
MKSSFRKSAGVAAVVAAMAGPVAALAATSPAANQYGGPPTPTITGTATGTATGTVAGSTVGAGGTAGAGGAVATRCISKRLLRISVPTSRIRGNERVVGMTVTVNGRTRSVDGNTTAIIFTPKGVVEYRGRARSNVVRLDFRGLLGKQTTNVTVSLRTNKGSTLTRRTSFHTCVTGAASRSTASSARFRVTRRGRGSHIARATRVSSGLGGGSGWIAFLMAGVAAVALGAAGRRLVVRRRSV